MEFLYLTTQVFTW